MDGGNRRNDMQASDRDRLTDRQRDRQAGRQLDRQADTSTCWRYVFGQQEELTYRPQTETVRQTDRQREADRPTDRDRWIDRQTETGEQTDRQADNPTCRCGVVGPQET